MSSYYVFAVAGLAASVLAVILMSSFLGLPIWAILIGIAMVSMGCLVLLADMNRPNGGSPGFKTNALMVFLFLPILPVLLPIYLILFVFSFVRNKVFRR